MTCFGHKLGAVWPFGPRFRVYSTVCFKFNSGAEVWAYENAQ